MLKTDKVLKSLIIVSIASGLSLTSHAQSWTAKEIGYMSGYVADDGSVDDGTMEVDEEESKTQTVEEAFGSSKNNTETEEEISKKNTPSIPGFPTKAYNQAMAYIKKYSDSFSNRKFVTIIDFTKPSNKKRMFIVNLETGGVESRLTSHGKGSDPRQTGYAKKFGNTESSHMTSLGFYRTLGTYRGHNGLSLKLQGLSKTNSNALNRDLVFHKANYVSENGGHAGRSHGCFAMDPKVFVKVIEKLKGGSLVYAWDGQ